MKISFTLVFYAARTSVSGLFYPLSMQNPPPVTIPIRRPGLPLLNLLLFFWTASVLGACRQADPPDPIDPGPAFSQKARVWLTRGDKSKLFSREADRPVSGPTNPGWPVISVDTSQRFQSIEGFGAALTGSSAYLLHRKMTAAQRMDMLRELFDPADGIGISTLRITMGASDFSLADFTYNDLPPDSTDFELQQFALGNDHDDVIPVLKEILQYAPGLSLIASPWSPPAWMKTNGSLRGGKLRPDCYSTYADYFVRYLQAMEEQGIIVNALTPQNEPLHFTANYPCMEMQAGEQLEFIKNHLGPALETAGLSTRIIVYDHNWDRPDYPIAILDDPDARKYVTGSAFHAYAGNYTAMGAVHQAHPDKELWFTEISGGEWATDFSGNLLWNMQNIFIGTTQNWSRSALLWNLVLDQQHGPTNNGCSDCRGVLTLNTTSNQITRNEEYYAIAHFSKFVRPGALRIASQIPQALPDIGAVAFHNPDGSKVMIVSNYGNELRTFSVRQGNQQFSYSVPARSVATLVW